MYNYFDGLGKCRQTFLRSACRDHSTPAGSNNPETTPSLKQPFLYQLLACSKRLAGGINFKNVRSLYEFFMKFNVFFYAMNPVEGFRGGRSAFTSEHAERREILRNFRLSPRLASVLQSRGPGASVEII